MSRTKLRFQAVEAQASHWTTIAITMRERIDEILAGKVPNTKDRVFDEVLELFELALQGYPLIDLTRSQVYLLVKKVLDETLGTSNERVVFYLVCWKNILEISRERGFSYLNDRDNRTHFQSMRLFFDALYKRGETERSAHRHQQDDDD